MEFTLDQGQGIYKIESYANHEIKISGKTYTESLIVMPDKLIVPWAPNSVYGNTRNTINTDNVSTNLSLSAGNSSIAHSKTSIKTIEDLRIEHFETLISFNPQVILLGTGETLQFPNPNLYKTLTTRGIGIEVMSTLAACRTYTVLMSEGRSVLAALIL